MWKGQSEGGLAVRGRGKGKDTKGERDKNMLHVYVQRQHKETHQLLHKKGRGREKNGNIKYSIHMYIITTMKSPHIINVY
jgi:hypothetical protein